MNATLSWLLAFLLTSITALTLLVGDRSAPREPVAARDPAKLSEIEAELILNRIREGDLVAIKGDLEQARGLWRAAREKGDGYWPIHEAIGDSFARHGLDAEADREYETAAQIAGKQLGREPLALRVKRAGILVRMKRPEPALNLLIESAEPAKVAGAMARILKESPDLLDVVKRAAESRDPRLWALIATVSTDPADQGSALGMYVRRVAPEDGELAKRAISQLRSTRPDEALEVCTAWARSAPSNPEVYETSGRLLAERGDRDRARLVLSTIVDVKPGDPGAHARLGAALRDLGHFADAIAQFKEVARLRPEEPGALQEIVTTQVAGGNIEGATAAFADLKARKWESRFGDVTAGLQRMIADVAQRGIDAARKAGDSATVTKLRQWCGKIGVLETGLFDIKIVMKWNAQSDVDLDVREPDGETVNHGHPISKHGGLYAFDNTQGRGPEHYTLVKAPPGKYLVGVHLHGTTPSIAEIEVILFEETPRERRLTARVELSGARTAQWPLEFEIP